MAYRNLNLIIGSIVLPVAIDTVFEESGSGTLVCVEHKTKPETVYFCKECDGPCERVLAHQINGAYVVIQPVEKPANEKDVRFEGFVKTETISPTLFDGNYVVHPQKSADRRGFYLVEEAMRQNKRSAVGKATLANKERVVVLRYDSFVGGLVLHTLRFEESAKRQFLNTLFPDRPTRLTADERQTAKSFVRTVVADYNPAEHKDKYSEEVRKAVAKIAAEQAPAVTVLDQMKEVVA